MTRPGGVAGTVAAAGALTLAYAVGIERRWYATRHETLEVLRRPGRLRVLFFADLHQAPGQDHRLDFVRQVAVDCQPDVVVSGGDNLEHADVIDAVVALHRDVLASTGAAGLAVLGAHDRYGPTWGNPATYLFGPSHGPRGPRFDTDRLVGGLTEAGWQVLQNAATSVATPAGSVQVVGVGDPHIDDDRLAVVADTPADPAAVLRLALVHAPYLRTLGAFDAAGFDLALAGHTHGGQLAVPWWGALVTNCDLPTAQAKGSSWIGTDLRLHVTAGLGHSVHFPFRFACRPELSILDLVGPAR